MAGNFSARNGLPTYSVALVTSNPTPVSEQQATQSLADLQAGSPWLAFGGIPAPYLGLFSAIGSGVAKLDPNVAFEGPKLLAQDVERFLVDQQLGARLIAAFGLVGVVLAMTGLYAVLAFGVAQRMREFGVRLALGARGADIIRLVLRHGLGLVAVGLVIGLAGAIGAGRVVSRFLYGISAVDPATLVAVPVLLVLVAVGACLVPARRGAAADPMTSLRAE
jgi:ABC-type antimicrobial peptide transport system permease subunit